MSAARKKSSTARSLEAHARACRVLPGGVNSPVRAFGAVDSTPRYLVDGRGAVVSDLDGNDYVDYVGSWGPMILGHADERVIAAVSKAVQHGLSFGAPSVSETRLAELIIAAMPSIELIRFVNSGTEAVMSAVRVARGFTGRDLIVKVEGGYHGHADSLLVSAGSGPATLGTPSSTGVPAVLAEKTISVPFNDLSAVEIVFDQDGPGVAAMVVEPVCGNMGLVPPGEDYLAGLQELCDRHRVLLILDEVMTGFRVAYGGAQERFGLRADLTCLGKIIGGGLPVGAYGGRRDIMELVSPLGPVYQAGTLSGNPLTMAAGLATLEALREPGTYENLEVRGAELAAGLEEAARKANVKTYLTRVGSMLCLFFCEGPVTDYVSAKTSNTDAYALYFREMLDRGIYLPPSQFETMFVSVAHSPEQIKATISASGEAMKAVAKRIGG